MPGSKDDERFVDAVMGIDPLGDDDEVLARTLYSSGNKPLATAPVKATAPASKRAVSEAVASTAPAKPSPPVRPQPKRSRRRAPEPQHYKVLSISLYNEDIERMDELVKELKKRGFTRMNRSALIRFALDQVDISKMPRGY